MLRALNALRNGTILALLLGLSGCFDSAGTWSGELFSARDARAWRSSSHDPDWQTGNADWRVIEPGETITLADIDGPGVIRHIWFTVNAYDPQFPRSLVLRMYWEGSDTPAVESPLGDFFATGHAMRKEINSEPVAVTSEGRAYNCYWPMPFQKHARITITNDSPNYKVPKFYFYIDYEQVKDLSNDLRRFHAQYRQEWPADEGDYLICDTEGAGHYVGTVMSVLIRTRGWFGEGDDRFYIDGDQEKPGLHGTGAEDYFCDAWGFREYMRPYYGVVLMEGFDFGDRVCVYRWHVRDPVSFRQSLRFVMEHKGTMVNSKGEGISGHYERPDYISSVAFWYQTGEAKRFAELPPLSHRLVPVTTIEMEQFVDQTEVSTEQASVTVQKGGAFSHGAQLLVDPDVEDVTVTIPFEVANDLVGVGRVVLTTSISAGVWKGFLDGVEIPKARHVDLFDKYYTPTDFNIGYVELQAGKHELKFVCQGKRATSRDYFLGVDALKIEHVQRYRVPAKSE
jgi:hypothetical protein